LSQGMDNDLILGMFVFETLQLIDQLEQIMLENEKTKKYDEDSINEIFRIIHTIKGSSAMMCFTGISELTHSMEDLFAYLRENKSLDVDYSKITDMILKGLDFTKGQVVLIQEGKDPQDNASKLICEIKECLVEIKGICGDEIIEKACFDGITDENGNELNKQDEQDEESKSCKNVFKAGIFFQEDCRMENIRAFGVVHRLEKIADNIRCIPENILDDEGSAEIIKQSGFKLIFKTGATLEEAKNYLSETLFLENLTISQADEKDIELFSEIKSPNNILAKAEDKQKTSAGEAGALKVKSRENPEKTDMETAEIRDIKSSVISVNLDKLDMLLDYVGELVISEAMVTRNPDIAGLNLENFQKAARQLRKVTSEIQDIVMSIRMVPVSMVFMKMNRIVRDMSKKLDKEVELDIAGEETEVDKNIIEHLSDPIMHLIRNSLDHGIENAKERLEKGKTKKGRIILEAKNEGGDVWITVRDDGKGLNREKILKKAREHGLLDKQESEYTDSEVYSMIFLPGFSTKENVSEFSGRGVGMDVVVKNIEKVGGSVHVGSKFGEGTTVHMKIPLTLAIINGMVVKVGDMKYIIPTTAIKESFQINENNVIETPEGEEMIMVRGECYPVTRLHAIFAVSTGITEIHKGIIIMVESSGSNMCLFVDELIEEQQVVVKALPAYIKNIWKAKCKNLGGCTLLGDGSVSLILDVAGIMSGR
jgi:two-component system, chemotaxis family, sensor kinase CheA